MKNLRKFIIGIAVLLLSLPLAACNVKETSIDDMLRPPQLSESSRQIQKAALSLIGSEHQLISPRTGNNRSAINLCDLDGDKQNEAVCLFSSADSPVGVLVLRQSGNKWTEWARYTGDATAVDRMDFSDLDGDGTKDILIGWGYLTGGDNVLEVLSLSGTIQSVHKELYSQFVVAGKKQDKIVLVNLTAASATLIGYRDHSYETLSSVPIDPAIQSFVSVLVSETTDGTPAVYLDVQGEKSYHTEVLVIQNDEYLENKLFTADKTPLDRQSSLRCTDIDADGIPEIPYDDSNAELTDWYTFDGQALSKPLVTFTSSAEQFYFVYPDTWLGQIHVSRDNKQERTYRFTDTSGTLIYSLRVFTVSEYRSAPENDWTVIIESADKVIAYQQYVDGKFSFATDEWAQALHTY